MKKLSLACVAALLPGVTLAGEPTCPVSEVCKFSNDNCQPAEGMLILKFLPESGKVEIRLNDNPPLESTILDMPGQTIMIFGEGQEEHQLRISEDGTFNYLITIPDPEAPKGKDQTLYRGKCMEG